jgi:hypothetical protein
VVIGDIAHRRIQITIPCKHLRRSIEQGHPTHFALGGTTALGCGRLYRFVLFIHS